MAKHIVFLFILFLFSCSNDSESGKSIKTYKYEIELKANEQDVQRSKENGSYEQDLENSMYALQKRFLIAGMQDLNPIIDFDKGEIIFQYNGPKEMPDEMLAKLLGSSSEVGFYETYDAGKILALIYGKPLQNYVIGKWVEDQDALDVLIDSNQIMSDYMQEYFPAYPAVDFSDLTSFSIPYVFIAKAEDTAKVNAILKDTVFLNPLAIYQDLEMHWGKYVIKDKFFGLYCLKTDFGDAMMSSSSIKEVTQNFDSQTQEPVVLINLTEEGRREFADLSSKNLDKYLAIALNDQVISAPKVQQIIEGGQVQISGNFNKEEIQELVAMLGMGNLAFEFKKKN